MLKDPDLISVQEVRSKVEEAYAAWQKYRAYSQEQVDAIVEQVAEAARANARRLAEVAVLQQAALQAGAPEGVIGCIFNSTLEATNALMKHRLTGVILSTGGSGIVRAAYSSGKPAFGVGPGNVPVLVDKSADIEEAVGKVVEGKSFDFGTVCSSAQAIVAGESLRERIMAVLKSRKAVICDARHTAALAKLLLTPQFTVNPDCVGQPPTKIAQMAGFEI